MKRQLSDLMDGELDPARSDAAWESLSSDAELRDCWRTYHLIGDCMRGEVVTDSVARSAPADKIMARLADEPTVLAPGRKAAHNDIVGRKTRIALALAASAATLSVIGILAARQEMLPQALLAQKQSAPAATQAAAAAPAPNVNDYLVLHRQFVNRDAILPATLVRDGKNQKQGAGR